MCLIVKKKGAYTSHINLLNDYILLSVTKYMAVHRRVELLSHGRQPCIIIRYTNGPSLVMPTGFEPANV